MFRCIQFWTTIVALVLSPFFFGSVDLFWVVLWTILLGLGAIFGITLPISRKQSRVFLFFLVVCCVYGLVAIVQFSPNVFVQLNDPVWAQAGGLLNRDLSGRISSRAEMPPLAIGHLLLFATSFANGFSTGTSRLGSEKLLWFARYSILFYVVYGIAALIFTPNMLLWAPKLAYRGSLTATFVNHNTAATFVGVGATLWFCSVFSSLQSFRFSSLRDLLLIPSNEKLLLRIILRSSAALICFFALLLTGSRGGLICSCFGLLVAVVLLFAGTQKWRSWQIAICIGVVSVVTIALLSRIGRIGSEGLLDDATLSVYGYCLEAIQRRPFLGAGAGTFVDIFPSILSDSVYGWGVWDYAHSTILEIAVEMGIPVAVVILIATIASLFVLIRATLKAKGSGRRSFAAITGIAVLGYLHSLIDFSLQIPGFMIVFGILLGCGLARATAPENESTRPRTDAERENQKVPSK